MGGAFSKSASPLKRPELDCITYTVRPAAREDIPAILWMIQLLAEHDGHRNVRKITEEDLLRDGFGDEKYFHCQVAELDGSDFPLAAATEGTALGANGGSRVLPSQNVDGDSNGSQVPPSSQNVNADSNGSQVPPPSQNMDADSDGSHLPPSSQNVDTDSNNSQVLPPSQSVNADSAGSQMLPSQNMDSRLVGFVFYYYGYCTWEGRVAFIEDLFVKSQFRKKGIGLALFRACAQAAVSNRCVNLHFDVDVVNQDAMKWYKKLGAKEVDKDLVDFELNGSSLDKLAAGGEI